MLTHIPDDVRDYGPLVGEATEVFECFNAVFRSCSILSNHQAPSRDIAIQLGGQDGFKQRISGGWWETKSGDWVQAGIAVRETLFNEPVVRNNLGWAGEIDIAGGLLFLSHWNEFDLRSRLYSIIPLRCSKEGSSLSSVKGMARADRVTGKQRTQVLRGPRTTVVRSKVLNLCKI